jgi:hypothetical protein
MEPGAIGIHAFRKLEPCERDPILVVPIEQPLSSGV